MNGFLPPVIFEIQANAAGAIAQFKRVNTELSIMEAKALKAGKALSGFEKSAVIGTRALKVMSLAFAAFAAYGVKEIIVLEKSLARLGQAMANAGVATKENLTATSALVDSYEDLGFGSEKAADAYSVLITATQDVEKSNKMLALAADLARARTMSLEDAARALARAQAGNARIFTQFGITLDNTKPKAEAVAEAMGKLEQRLSGQAQAYAKTFAGQLAILNEGLGDIAEQIGMRVLPALNKFVAGLNNSGAWIKKNSDFVIALGIAITVALIPAVVNLTRKLALLALTILKSPIGRLAAIVFAVSYAFVKAYNSSEDFRKKLAGVVKFGISAFGYLVGAAESLIRPLSLAAGLGLKLRKAFQELKNDDIGAAKTAKEIKAWEEEYAKIGDWTKAIEKAKKSVDDFAEKKISLKWDFKMPQIPGFDNKVGGGVVENANEISDALIKAKQNVLDFRQKVIATAADIKDAWSTLVGRDTAEAIQDGLSNPIELLAKKATLASKEYLAAVSEIKSAVRASESANQTYLRAVQSENVAAIAAAESAMKSTQKMVDDLQGSIGKALSTLTQLQDEIITKVIELENEIISLTEERQKAVLDAAVSQAEIEKTYLAEKTALYHEYNRNVEAAELEAAKSRATIIKNSIDQLRGIFRTATDRSVGDIFDALTFQGRYVQGGTPSALVNALKSQLDKTKALADDASKLAGLGFSQTFIEQVISQGPELGHQLAQNIINASPQSIQELKGYWEELNNLSQHGVDTVANNLNQTMTLATEELTFQLAQVGIDLRDKLAGYSKDLQAGLTASLLTYNDETKKIADALKLQLEGIDDKIADTMRRIAQLKTSLTVIGETPPPDVQPPASSPIAQTIADVEQAVAEAEAAAAEAEAAAASAAAASAAVDVYLASIGIKPTTPVASSIDSNAGRVSPGNFRRAEEASNASGAMTSTGYWYNGSYRPFLAEGGIVTKQTTAVIGEAGPEAVIPLSKLQTMIGSGSGNPVNVTINANTNATSASIASDVGWAIRTSSDLNFASTGTYNT